MVIDQTAKGQLFRVDPESGETKSIDAGGYLFTNCDGLRFAGGSLYVVQNADNKVAKVRLNSDLSAGVVEGAITNPALRVPTTIASFGDTLYAVNARFDTPPTPNTQYEVVGLPRR